MNCPLALAAVLTGAVCSAAARDYTVHTFKKIQLTPQFWAEGAHYGDVNRDGANDVVYGPFWWEGPEFDRRHEYRPATTTFKLKQEGGAEKTVPGFEGGLGVKNAYSDNFLTFTRDLNSDGWIDIVVVGMPGEQTFWFENPKGRPGQTRPTRPWSRRLGAPSTRSQPMGLGRSKTKNFFLCSAAASMA